MDCSNEVDFQKFRYCEAAHCVYYGLDIILRIPRFEAYCSETLTYCVRRQKSVRYMSSHLTNFVRGRVMSVLGIVSKRCRNFALKLIGFQSPTITEKTATG